MPGDRKGRQEPTFQRVGGYASSDGAEVVAALAEAGVAFLPCQAYEMELMRARDAGGRFAARVLGISRPRQNGKSFCARNYAAVSAAVDGMRVLYSAHHGKTTRSAFDCICAMFEGPDAIPEYAESVRHIFHGDGGQSIELHGGGCVDFQTRTASGGRGETYDIIIVDEAQELTEAQRDAIQPTTLASASGNPQMIFLGTPPSPQCAGTVFRELHDRAHSGAGGVWWLEWGVGSLPGRDAPRSELMELAWETNPLMGHRIREDVMASMMDTMGIESLARECLGWWQPAAAPSSRAFDPAAWDACATDAEPAGDVCYGVKISPDGAEAALSACWRGDVPHFELVDHRDTSRGLGWLAEWLDERAGRCAMLAVDGRNAAALTTRLENYRPRQLHVMATRDAISAAALIVDGIRGRTVTHYGQRELDEQAKAAVRRPVGRDAWCLGGESSTAIESAACALWAARNARYKPGRKARIG